MKLKVDESMSLKVGEGVRLKVDESMSLKVGEGVRMLVDGLVGLWGRMVES